MPPRGEEYNKVPIALELLVKDWLNEHPGTRVADFGRLLYDQDGKKLDPSRAHQMARGEINALKYLQIAVESVKGGGYLSMAKYAEDAKGLEILRDLQTTKKLNPYNFETYRLIKTEILKTLLKSNHTQDVALRDYALKCFRDLKKDGKGKKRGK